MQFNITDFLLALIKLIDSAFYTLQCMIGRIWMFVWSQLTDIPFTPWKQTAQNRSNPFTYIVNFKRLIQPFQSTQNYLIDFYNSESYSASVVNCGIVLLLSLKWGNNKANAWQIARNITLFIRSDTWPNQATSEKNFGFFFAYPFNLF